MLGVNKPAHVGPVRLVDIFFDPSAVEGPIRKAVNCKNVAVFLRQPGFELIEVIVFEKFKSRLSREPKADSELFAGSDTIAHR